MSFKLSYFMNKSTDQQTFFFLQSTGIEIFPFFYHHQFQLLSSLNYSYTSSSGNVNLFKLVGHFSHTTNSSHECYSLLLGTRTFLTPTCFANGHIMQKVLWAPKSLAYTKKWTWHPSQDPFFQRIFRNPAQQQPSWNMHPSQHQ